MKIKLRGKCLSNCVHIHTIPFWTGFQYHILLTSCFGKPNALTKPIDHAGISIHGHDISSMNMLDGLLTYLLFTYKIKDSSFTTLGKIMSFSPSSSFLLQSGLGPAYFSKKKKYGKKGEIKGFSRAMYQSLPKNAKSIYPPMGLVSRGVEKFLHLDDTCKKRNQFGLPRKFIISCIKWCPCSLN